MNSINRSMSHHHPPPPFTCRLLDNASKLGVSPTGEEEFSSAAPNRVAVDDRRVFKRFATLFITEELGNLLICVKGRIERRGRNTRIESNFKRE